MNSDTIKTPLCLSKVFLQISGNGYCFLPPPHLFSTTSPKLSCFTGISVTLRQTSKHYDGHIWNSVKHMPRNMLGISCHRPRFIKHIYLDDTLHHLDCIISSLLSLRSSEQHASIGLGPCTNKPVVMLAFCRVHTHTAGKGLILSLLLTVSHLTAFTLNEVPRQFTICAGQIKNCTPGGVWSCHLGQ